ncbi:MAG: PorP/SprF family type IX secretion system membrane protein [Flavitalea sp.]
MKKLMALLAASVICLFTNAQTYHFSQFYSTPLLINPAATGLTQGPYRLAANYRTQWNGAGSPYVTSTFSGDAHILANKVAEGNILGLGLVLLNDKTMNGVVQTNSIAASTAYHISLDPENVQTIGLGFQGTYNERRVDFSRLEFENQFGNGGYDPSLPVGESLESGKKYYLDLNLGAMYSFAQEDRSFFAGFSAYNLLKKQDSYLTEQFKTPPLFSAIAGGDIDLGVDNSLYLSGNFRQQGNNREITLGMAYGFFLDEYGYSVVKVGLWHRVQDALIPYVGLTYKGVQLGCSYDYNISGTKTRSQIKNTFEISLLYLAPDKTELKRLIPWY